MRMKTYISILIGFCVFWIVIYTPFLQNQEPLPPNWNIESPIVEDIYPTTQNRGVFVGYDGLHIERRGTYPSDTLQLQLHSDYTDLYIEFQSGNQELAMVMGEKRPKGVKHMPISTVLYTKDGYVRRSLVHAQWQKYPSTILHLKEYKNQWSIYDAQKDKYYPMGAFRPATLEMALLGDQAVVQSLRILKNDVVLLDETYQSSPPYPAAIIIGILFCIITYHVSPSRYCLGLVIPFGLLFVDPIIFIGWLDRWHAHIPTTDVPKWLMLFSFWPYLYFYINKHNPKPFIPFRSRRKYIQIVLQSIDVIREYHGTYIILVACHFMIQSPISVIILLILDLYFVFVHSDNRFYAFGIFCYFTMLFSPLGAVLLLLSFRIFQISRKTKNTFVIVLLQLILLCEIAISQLYIDHFKVAQPQKEIAFEKTFEGNCNTGKNWQVVGTNSIFAPRNNQYHSYLIEMQKKHCSSLQIYTNPTATFSNSWNLIQQLPNIPTLIHFGVQDLLSTRTYSTLHPLLQNMSSYSNVLYVLHATSTRKGNIENPQTLSKKLQILIKDKKRPVLLMLDVVQANHSGTFLEIQKEINQLSQENQHISTIDTVNLFTDEQRDQILSDNFKISYIGHEIMLSKVESSLMDWLQIQTSSE